VNEYVDMDIRQMFPKHMGSFQEFGSLEPTVVASIRRQGNAVVGYRADELFKLAHTTVHCTSGLVSVDGVGKTSQRTRKPSGAI
jgi:hypothetical protein